MRGVLSSSPSFGALRRRGRPGAPPTPPAPVEETGARLLLEDGVSALLLEDGSYLLLES